MKIGIAGPISTDSVSRFLRGDLSKLPKGYSGAPLFGTLIGALLERGHRISAFTTSAGLPLSSENVVVAEGERFKIYYCPVRPHAFRPKGGHLGRGADFFRLEREGLRRAMLEDKPDVIHAHWMYEFALAAIESGIPHVVTCHDAPQAVLRYMPNLYRFIRYLMARKVFLDARCLTAVSPYLREKVRHYSRMPITVVPNPLPDGIYKVLESDTRAVFDPERPRIAMILNGWGRLKNPKPALTAFALLRIRMPDAQLHLFGIDYGPGEKAQQWVDMRGLSDGITFHGFMTHEKLLNMLDGYDLLLHPSLLESCPMSVAEAMALSLPIVGGKCSGGVPWVIGEGGIVTDVTSPQALAVAMEQLLSDVELYKHYSYKAARRANDFFRATTVAEQYEKIYFDVLAKPANHKHVMDHHVA